MQVKRHGLKRLLSGLLGILMTALCSAQYSQTVIERKVGSQTQLFWQPDKTLPQMRVVNLQRFEVVLEYNCEYLTSICANVREFYGNTSSSAKFLTYDMISTRADARRKKTCPSSWKKGSNGLPRCPEPNQPKFYRNDSLIWPYTALQPGVINGKTMKIADKVDPNNNTIEESGVIYTCDEFPAASWVEGGIGNGGVQDRAANTYCAPMGCMRGKVKKRSEQNWQASVHTRLRAALNFAGAQDRNPIFKENISPMRFIFLVTNKPNNIAATVYIKKLRDNTVEVNEQPLNKRDEPTLWERIKPLSGFAREAAVLQALENDPEGFLGDASRMHTHHIFTNGTYPDEPDILYQMDPLREDDEDESLQLSSLSTLESSSLSPRLEAFYSPNFHNNGMEMRSEFVPDETYLVDNDSAIDASHLLKNTTADEIAKAEKLLDEAIAENDARMVARMGNMARNHYVLKPKTNVGSKTSQIFNSPAEPPTPFLEITSEMKKAAALMAIVDAARANKTATRRSVSKRAGSFWMESLPRRGTVPWGNDPNYKVFRNVMDYGAKADGVTDDSEAFRKAMNDGRRCGKNCNGSTTKNAIVYVPPGTYVIASTVPVIFGTQLIGDAKDWPTLKAAPRMLGKGILSTDEYTGGGLGPDGLDKEWYINTANFYRQIRNFKLDLSGTRDVDGLTAIHYQIAQATSLQFIEITARPSQTAIFSENGSGGVISDITIKGGKYGFYGGNQQFTALRLTFDGCATAVRVIWDWGWVWKSVTVKNAKVGFQLVALKEGEKKKRQIKRGKPGSIGSSSFLDSVFTSVDTAIVVKPVDSKPGSGSTGVVLQNCVANDVKTMIADTDGKTVLQSLPSDSDAVLGPIYHQNGTRDFANPGNEQPSYVPTGASRPTNLLGDGNAYYERAKPQYENLSPDDFVSVKSLGAMGDGVTDDTSILEQAIYNTTIERKVTFIDAGSYIITRTITIPPGAVIVGEAWSQLVAFGEYFSDPSDPKVMLRVGEPGSVGSVELQDLIFTTKGPTAGAVLVEWNIKAGLQGSAALWDCHARIGGATGTDLTPAECPPITSGLDPKCQAASLMMHITSQASGYFENMWLWVADHMIDDPDLDDPDNEMVQTSVYVARGFLIESQQATWLYGTASEHSVMYQYNFNKASNIFACMIQTESPYYQPNPLPPAPFDQTVGVYDSDPIYSCGDKNDELSGCDESWALIVQQSKQLSIFGAGLYSWFSTYSQDCIDDQKCQKALALFKDNYVGIQLFHVITIGAKYMAVIDGNGLEAKENLNFNGHPFWSQVSVVEIKGGDGSPDPGHSDDGDIIWIDPAIWDPDHPKDIICDPPCTIQLPPWTSYTSILPYPPVTYSDNTTITVITRSAITISEWVIEPITISHIGPRPSTTPTTKTTTPIITTITPKYDTTTTWPPVTISKDPHSTTTPTETHPPPPRLTTTDPTKAPPPVTIKSGTPPSPTVPPCAFPAFQCPPRPDDPDGPGGSDPGDPDDDDEEHDDDPDTPGFCFYESSDDYPMGSECQGGSNCSSCPTGWTARCVRGWCGCQEYIPVDGHLPDPGDGSNSVNGRCSAFKDCQVFACEDGQDPYCAADDYTCTCPPPVGAACEKQPEFECSDEDCFDGWFPACIDKSCRCARGIRIYGDERGSPPVTHSLLFSLLNAIDPSIDFDHNDTTVGFDVYHADFSNDAKDVKIHFAWDGTNSHVNYTQGDYKLDFTGWENQHGNCKDPDICYKHKAFYALDWEGRDPDKNYTVYT